MTTLRSLDGQQVTWNYGAIDLMCSASGASILWLGWPVLYTITIAQTIVMAGRLSGRQRGYQV